MGNTFRLYIDLDTDAFQPDPRPELAQLLEGIAARINEGQRLDVYQTIHDVNGNDVGRFAIKPMEIIGGQSKKEG